ncbi:MAG: hypothetical protein Satyrvirus7_25 [Satyrvirus sp.]|uniref:Sulfatase N-terminal domain-containing protein n=1 Tax=Satyrvirus sp. TaxID=2487771 RepID=A0A3G5AG27_9VIRU|nr:MAG: hypothetical protein Satyrvirus7_25 [Satyrvirus sp.]
MYCRPVLIFLLLVVNFVFAKNVLLIISDDMNIKWMGNTTVTPNLDRISKENGVTTFRKAYSNTCMCNPSRTSFLTGTYPSQNGIHKNSDLLHNLTFLMDDLKHYGIKTGGIGKVLHNTMNDIYKKRVWDIYVDFTNNSIRNNLCHTSFKKFKCGMFPDNVEQTLENPMMFQSAVEIISAFKNGNKNWFVGLGYKKPHIPLYSPQKYWVQTQSIFDNFAWVNVSEEIYGMSASALDVFKLNDSLFQQIRKINKLFVHAYASATAYTDKYIGKMWDYMKNNQLLNDTMVIIISDHGWHLGEKDHISKYTLYMEGLRIPFMIYVPNSTNSINNTPVSLIDLYDTIMEWMDIPKNHPNSLLKYLNSVEENRNLYMECYLDVKTTSTYNNTYSAINYLNRTDIYNIKNDPLQRTII